MPETVLLVLAVVAAGVVVCAPLWRPAAASAAVDDEREAAAVRHRVAIEALRDLEADRRAGSLDDDAYAAQLADAEARAAETRRALRRTSGLPADGSAAHPGSRRTGLVAAGAIGLALVLGSTLPAAGLASRTVINEQLAAAREAEAARQDRIEALLDRVQSDPRDADALSDLADAYLEGSTRDDLVRGAVALRLLIDAQPARADAYERIVTAYLRAGDYVNARAALGSYAELETADPAGVAFFEGLIALRGDDDPAAALGALDRFLELAPEDPRAAMVRELRDEAVEAVEAAEAAEAAEGSPE